MSQRHTVIRRTFHKEWRKACSTRSSTPGDTWCREPTERCERNWLPDDNRFLHIRYMDRNRKRADRRSWAPFALRFGNRSAARNYRFVWQPDTVPHRPVHRPVPLLWTHSTPNSRASTNPNTHTLGTWKGRPARSPPPRNKPTKSFAFLNSPFLFSLTFP